MHMVKKKKSLQTHKRLILLFLLIRLDSVFTSKKANSGYNSYVLSEAEIKLSSQTSISSMSPERVLTLMLCRVQLVQFIIKTKMHHGVAMLTMLFKSSRNLRPHSTPDPHPSIEQSSVISYVSLF